MLTLIDKFCKNLAVKGKNSVSMTNSIIKFKLKFIAFTHLYEPQSKRVLHNNIIEGSKTKLSVVYIVKPEKIVKEK